MKKRYLAVPFLCAVALTSTGIALTSASALDDSKEAIVPQDVNWTASFAGFAGAATSVNMGDASGDGDWTAMTQEQLNHIAYVDASNQNIAITLADTQGAYFNINRGQPRQAAIGDLLTIKAGFPWAGKEVKSDISYLYQTENQPWVVFNPTYLTPSVTELTVYVDSTAEVTFTTDYSIAPLSCTVEDSSKASVTSNGLTATVTGLAEGTTTLNVACGGQTAEVKLNVEKKTAELESISVTGELNAYVGATAIDYSTLTAKKIYDDASEVPFTVTQAMISGDYNLNTVGDYTLTVTAEGKTANVTLHVLELPALTVSNINVGAWGFMICFGDTYSGLSLSGIPESGFNNFEVKNAAGESILNQHNWLYHENYIFGPINSGSYPNAVFEIGTVITLKKGFVFAGHEMKADVSYVYTAVDTPFEVYDAATHTPTSVTTESATASNITYVKSTLQLNSTVAPATAATTVKYSSSDPSVATVDAYTGLVTGVSVGEVTINVSAGTATTSITLKVEPELEFQNKLEFTNVYKIWVAKDGTLALPSDIKVAPLYLQDGNDVYGREFALSAENCTLSTVDTSVTGDTTMIATVTYEENTYDMEIEVKVYQIEDMQIKELGIVEWFAYATFIQFPASTINVANLTDGSLIPDATKLTYTREDGTNMPFGIYNLGGGNIAVMPQFNNPDNIVMTNDNFNQPPFYQKGDTITLQKGLTGYLWTGEFAPTPTDSNAIKPGTGMVIPECVLNETVSYVFDGSVWMVYIAYTDFTVKESVEVNVGAALSVGAVRVPDNATEGIFTYVSSDTSVATVNANGRVTGVKEGTATITVTLDGGVAGKIEKTVTVTVTDGITSLKIEAGTVLTVAKGTDNLDLSQVPATFVWASGKTEKADLTNATVIGYDKDTVGETEVTIRVSVNGKNYQAQLTVVVSNDSNAGSGSVSNNGGNTDNNGGATGGENDATEGGGCSGCSSSMDAVSIATSAALMLGAALVLVLKRKTER